MGDRLIAVDGFPLDNVTLNEAYNILRNSNGHSSRLTIEYDVTNMKMFSGPLLVEMESPHPHQLGLTLTNTPHNAAVLIDEIRPASIAERYVPRKHVNQRRSQRGDRGLKPPVGISRKL